MLTMVLDSRVIRILWYATIYLTVLFLLIGLACDSNDDDDDNDDTYYQDNGDSCWPVISNSCPAYEEKDLWFDIDEFAVFNSNFPASILEISRMSLIMFSKVVPADFIVFI